MPAIAKPKSVEPRGIGSTRYGFAVIMVAGLVSSAIAIAPTAASAQDRPTMIVSVDERDLATLKAQVERLAATADKMAAVSIYHPQSGSTLGVRDDVLMPMASTYKVAIAVQALHLVDQGKMQLDDLVEIKESDLVSWSLLDERVGAGAKVSLRSLIRLMLVLSDNSATDVVLRVAGGGEAVTSRLKTLGVIDMQVARGTRDLLIDYFDHPEFTRLTRAQGMSFRRAAEQLASNDGDGETDTDVFFDRIEAEKAATPEAYDAFLADPRDQASTSSMNALLTKIWMGEALSEDSTRFLLETMRATETGPGRIKGLLPLKTVVAHKTGTLTGGGGVVNNCGIIELPNGHGELIVTIFVRHTRAKEYADQERVIAEIARTAYDFFVTRPASYEPVR